MKAPVFFRNDDLGWAHPQLIRLARMFERHHTKISMAAIPMPCLDQFPQNPLSEFKSNIKVLVHGLTHLDFAGSGKKNEFGETRDVLAVQKDILRGREIIESLFTDQFVPIFTPPWNRIAEKHLPALREAGFKALSVDGPVRFPNSGLTEINVTVDLHTNRKEKLGLVEVKKIMSEATAPVGIVVHHKHMDDNQFVELENILDWLNQMDHLSLFMDELL